MSHCVRPSYLICSICGDKVPRSTFMSVHLPGCRAKRELKKLEKRAQAGTPPAAATAKRSAAIKQPGGKN